jgi:hypothetical protein
MDWLVKEHEFTTEVMTQYALGNLKPGSRLTQFAEALLRHSDDPEIAKLVGVTFGLALAIKGALPKSKDLTNEK